MYKTIAIYVATSAVLFGCTQVSLARAKAPEQLVCDGVLSDVNRDREIPVRVRMPESQQDEPAPVILFSHGLGGSVDGGTAWGEAWSKAGYGVIHVQHPGSDRSLLADGGGMQSLRKGATAEQLFARLADMKWVASAVGKDQSIGACLLKEFDPARMAAAGHSFGAQTVQALAGQVFDTPAGPRTLGDPRFVAFIAFSPSPPRNDPSLANAAFAAIDRPFFSVTGSEDGNPLQSGVAADVRTSPHAAMPNTGKYLVVFDGADHMTFNGGQLRRPRQENDDRVWAHVARLTTLFLDGHLRADKQARDKLAVQDVKASLATNDRYEVK